MSSDTERHRELLAALKDAQNKNDGSFERAVTAAFEHVFEHLGRLNAHLSPSGADGEDPTLAAGESPTLR